jgi:parvulin-like peptidyl-prolyl isomerase
MFPIPIGRRGHVTPGARDWNTHADELNVDPRTVGFHRRFGRSGWVLVAFLTVLGMHGCKGFQKKHENPVLRDAPHRVTHIEPETGSQVAKADERSTVDPVKGENNQPGFKLDPWEGWEDDTAIYNSKVAATVNGAPILNGDVLDRYAGYLISVREDMRKKRVPPDDYVKLREAFVHRDLEPHIQRRLLVESMKSSLKPDQIKSLQGHLDVMFEREIEKLKRELKVSTRTELELELNKKGTTLENVKESFATERMAMEYAAIKMDKAEHIDRNDLINYYHAHLDEYAVAAKVEWEQIQISFNDKASQAKARERMKLALRELRDGARFEDVARKYSDGPSAKQGGAWEPMEAGSLADTKLETMLFEMPIGPLSDVYEGPSELQLVRVKSRQEAGRIPLGDVQDEIRQKLELEQNKKRSQKFLKELRSDAIVETKYDGDEMPQ